jgi:hypothetical protein
VIVTGPPTATLVTSPAAETLAIAGFDEAQVTTRPRRVLPSASFSAVASCLDSPRRIDVVFGLTTTVATGAAVTVTAAAPLTPPLVAVIVTGPPGATPDTNPPVVTVATDVFALLQVTVWPARVVPLASLRVAASCLVAPTTTDVLDGTTSMVATVGGGGGGSTLPPAAFEHATSPAPIVKEVLIWNTVLSRRRCEIIFLS